MPDNFDGQEYARKELKRRIEESDIGITRYAKERLIRDPSTVHRWLHDNPERRSPIPEVIIQWLLGNFRYRSNSK
jgi:hypothetical protein